eukprot:scaffold15348_cov38-Phaeocystis_antarctica.AAC.2
MWWSGVARAWQLSHRLTCGGVVWRELGEARLDRRVTHQWRHGLASQAVQAEREWRCRASGAGVDAAASSVMNQSRAAAAPVESVARDAHAKTWRGGRPGRAGS